MQQTLLKAPNGHLHLALVAVLLVATLIALAIPLRTRASESASFAPLIVTDEALTTLRLAPDDAAPGRLAVRDEPVAFTLHANGLTTAQKATGMTVGEALADAGVSLRLEDKLSPGPGVLLSAGMHVYVTYAQRFELTIAGEERTLYTQAKTVGEALAAMGMPLEPTDIVIPLATAPLTTGTGVLLTTVRNLTEPIEEPIAFSTTFRYDANISDGEQVVIQPGVDGVINRVYSVRRVNGAETSRVLLSETTTPPMNAVVAIGTYTAPASVPVAAVAAPGGECIQWMSVWSTYYTAASAGGNGITRTGTGVYKGIIATDPTVIPLGTHMYVPGYGYGIAADTGGGVKGAHIDLGYGDNDVYDWGSKYLDICILD